MTRRPCPRSRRGMLGDHSEFGRRDLLAAAAGLAALGPLAGAARFEGKPDDKTLGIPGPFRGRVVEVKDPAAVKDGVPDADAVRAMVRRGITGLTGINEPVEAWRSMFQPGDVVGIKVNPVGNPHAISNYATVHALTEGLRSAGLKPKDILVFDRYRDQFLGAGYEKHLPDGCR